MPKGINQNQEFNKEIIYIGDISSDYLTLFCPCWRQSAAGMWEKNWIPGGLNRDPSKQNKVKNKPFSPAPLGRHPHLSLSSSIQSIFNCSTMRYRSAQSVQRHTGWSLLSAAVCWLVRHNELSRFLLLDVSGRNKKFQLATTGTIIIKK